MKFVAQSTRLLFIALLLIAAGCARSEEESADDAEKRLLEAYMSLHHPGVQPTESGLYFIEEQVGTGDTPSPAAFVFVNYTARDLSGTILYSGSTPVTNSADMARQLGTFAHSTYYGPTLWQLGSASLYTGLEEALQRMKTGGKARVVMPSWLSVIQGFSDRQYGVTTLYDLELLRVVEDMKTYQTDTLRAFSERYYGGLDTLKTDWYFQTLAQGSGGVAQVGDTLMVRYIGYLLDGFVFDTNIADSAMFYKIYDPKKSYPALVVPYKEGASEGAEATMDVVGGFKYALQRMEAGQEAVTFFSSDLGYEGTASGQIQKYSPLRFYVKVERIGRKQ
jgi:FKBP-type peptidyl-prolyl cis-trans isomerase